MDDATRRWLAIGAVGAPALHSLTDVAEWVQGGFSGAQLWANYIAFLPMPFIVIGLYAAQRPAIHRAALWGALLYGIAFIYFAHTTLFALAVASATYEELWARLGWLYTLHGAVMVVGGLIFGGLTLKARVLPQWTAWLFLAGVASNFVLAVVPAPDLWQTIGTTIRNVGLIGMGLSVARPAPENAVLP